MTRFYERLKDNVKDDFYREDILDTFIEYIQCVIKIDDRLYVHCIERCSQRLSMLR